jgi:hypothetical protein
MLQQSHDPARKALKGHDPADQGVSFQTKAKIIRAFYRNFVRICGVVVIKKA